MKVKELIENLKKKGIRLHKTGDRLKWKTPRGALTAGDKKELKRNKSAILKLVDGPNPIKLGPRSLIRGDCLEVMNLMSSNSVDLIVTDPPYGLKFMGKDWDKAVPSVKVWEQCLRVLKPGAFAFIMCSPRQDVLSRMIVNLDDAGFITRFTSLYWTYASGFPKAHNISKTIDKKAGVERVPIKRNPNSRENCGKSNTIYESGTVGKTDYITTPVTQEAKYFDGAYGGFQPKPAVEVIIVVQKPPTQRTQYEQALDNGKGVTWLDDCRIPYIDDSLPSAGDRTCNFGEQATVSGGKYGLGWEANKHGRFPANLQISDDVLGKRHSRYFSLDAWAEHNLPFLIEPKASKKEKEFGLENFEPTVVNDGRKKSIDNAYQRGETEKLNGHPTVKPIKLMSYMITMGSREGDIVLDPFCGSGTTCMAAHAMGRAAIGIEKNSDYFDIATARVRALNHKMWRENLKSAGG